MKVEISLRLRHSRYCGYRHPTDPLDMPSLVPDWWVPIHPVPNVPRRHQCLGGLPGWERLPTCSTLCPDPPDNHRGRPCRGRRLPRGVIAALVSSAALQHRALSLALSRLPTRYFSGESFDSAVGRLLVFDDVGNNAGLRSNLSVQARAYFGKVLDAAAPRLYESRRALLAYLAGAAEALCGRALLLTRDGLVGLGPRWT
jgi:hypothetical protein